MSSHVHSSVRTGLAHLAFCCVCRAWHTAQPTHSSLCSLQKPRPFPLGCWELSGAGAAKHASRTSSRPPQPGSHSHKAPDLTLPRSPDTSGLGKDLEPYLGSNKQRKHINTACLPPASLLLIQAPSHSSRHLPPPPLPPSGQTGPACFGKRRDEQTAGNWRAPPSCGGPSQLRRMSRAEPQIQAGPGRQAPSHRGSGAHQALGPHSLAVTCPSCDPSVLLTHSWDSMRARGSLACSRRPVSEQGWSARGRALFSAWGSSSSWGWTFTGEADGRPVAVAFQTVPGMTQPGRFPPL